MEPSKSSRRRVNTFATFFLFWALFSTPGSAQNEKPFIVIDDTTSPDGTYAVAWGIPYTPLDVSDMDKLMSNLNFDAIQNFIVDVKKDEILTTLGTTFFPSKNHGGLSVNWREDSKAVLVLEHGKWEYRAAVLVYKVGSDDETNPWSDVLPITEALRRGLKAQILADHPEEEKSIDQFAFLLTPQRWVSETQFLFDVNGDIPKADDAFSFRGTMTVNLPGPTTITTGSAAVSNPTRDSGRRSDTQGLAITANSAGPIKLGMTIGEARSAMRGTDFSRTSDGEGIALINVSSRGNDLMRLYAGEENAEAKINDNAVIELIEVWSPDFKTPEGISVGMPISLVEKLPCGELKEIIMSEIESREYARFTKRSSGLSYRVNHDGGGTAGKYRTDERVTSRYTPGAKILSIDISGANVMDDGSIGGIQIASTGAEVLAIAEKEGLGEAFKGKDEIWEAFGQAVQKWIFPEAGLSVNMISDEIGGPKTVFSIELKAPSKLSTGRGITLGDTKEKVIAAYADFKSDSGELDGFFEGKETHLVGSIYGGMIFTFSDGKLSEIFLGAAAE